jgi:hypothetical protein
VPYAPPQLTSLFHAEAMEWATFLMSSGRPCWLAQFDEEHRDCEGKIEAFHFINRQRVRHVVGGYLPKDFASAFWNEELGEFEFWEQREIDELVVQAEWDPRNAGPGCEMHHRRLDGQRMPQLIVPREALADQVIDFASDWALETALEERYPTR